MIQTGRARLRAGRPARRRRPPRHRRATSESPGKDAKSARHPDPRDRRGPAPMAHRTPRPARRPTVPDPPRPAAEPLHGRAARRQARRHRGSQLPVAERQARHPAHAAPHQRHALLPRGSTSPRSRCGSATRAPNHPHLPARTLGNCIRWARCRRSPGGRATAMVRPIGPTRRLTCGCLSGAR